MWTTGSTEYLNKGKIPPIKGNISNNVFRHLTVKELNEILSAKLNGYVTASAFNSLKAKVNSLSSVDIPSSLSAFANDAGYVTASQVASLLGQYSRSLYTVVSVLPSTVSEIDADTIYLVPVSNAEGLNSYQEYIYADGNWELLGETKLDLSGYATIPVTDSLDARIAALESGYSALAGNSVDLDRLQDLLDSYDTSWQESYANLEEKLEKYYSYLSSEYASLSEQLTSSINSLEASWDTDKAQLYKDLYAAIQEQYDTLFDTDGYFTGKINPLAIQTAMLGVGTSSSNFQLVNITFDPNHIVTSGDSAAKDPDVFCVSYGDSPQLVHFELDADDGTSGVVWWDFSDASENVNWETTTDGVSSTSNNIEDKPYYLYAVCERPASTAGSAGYFLLSDVQYAYDSVDGYYYLLVGTLSSKFEDTNGTYYRILNLSYGSTSITGRFIKTGRIQSVDGATYFDLDTGEIHGNITFTYDNATVDASDYINSLIYNYDEKTGWTQDIKDLKGKVSTINTTISDYSTVKSDLDDVIADTKANTSELVQYASDDWIVATEKTGLKQQYNDIINEYEEVINYADDYKPDSTDGSYSSYMTVYDAYIKAYGNAITAFDLFCNLSLGKWTGTKYSWATPVYIGSITDVYDTSYSSQYSYIKAYYDARQSLVTAVQTQLRLKTVGAMSNFLTDEDLESIKSDIKKISNIQSDGVVDKSEKRILKQTYYEMYNQYTSEIIPSLAKLNSDCKAYEAANDNTIAYFYNAASFVSYKSAFGKAMEELYSYYLESDLGKSSSYSTSDSIMPVVTSGATSRVTVSVSYDESSESYDATASNASNDIAFDKNVLNLIASLSKNESGIITGDYNSPEVTSNKITVSEDSFSNVLDYSNLEDYWVYYAGVKSYISIVQSQAGLSDKYKYMYDTLVKASGNNTTITGGLVVTSTILLGEKTSSSTATANNIVTTPSGSGTQTEASTYIVNAGVNGVKALDENGNVNALGGGIAFWAGGTMIDGYASAWEAKHSSDSSTFNYMASNSAYLITNTPVSFDSATVGVAKAVIRFDGSGYFSSNFYWDTAGNVYGNFKTLTLSGATNTTDIASVSTSKFAYIRCQGLYADSYDTGNKWATGFVTAGSYVQSPVVRTQKLQIASSYDSTDAKQSFTLVTDDSGNVTGVQLDCTLFVTGDVVAYSAAEDTSKYSVKTYIDDYLSKQTFSGGMSSVNTTDSDSGNAVTDISISVNEEDKTILDVTVNRGTFVDTSTDQTISGLKTFSKAPAFANYATASYTGAKMGVCSYCSTDSATAAKEAVMVSYMLIGGTSFWLYVSNSNTSASALTLNVNSTGAKTLYINGTVSSSSNYTLSGWYWVIYNGTYFYAYNTGTAAIAAATASSLDHNVSIYASLDTEMKGTNSLYDFTSGTAVKIPVSGTLPVSQGGTGQTDIYNAANALFAIAYCSTSASNPYKQAVMSNYVCVYGVPVWVYFANANTYQGTLYLTINAYGPSTIYINNSLTSSSNYTLSGWYCAVYVPDYGFKLFNEKAALPIYASSDTSNELMLVGVSKDNYNLLKRDSNVSVTGGTLNATTIAATTVSADTISAGGATFTDSVTIESQTTLGDVTVNGDMSVTGEFSASIAASDIASGTVSIAHGGTGASSASSARLNLGLGSIATYDTSYGTKDSWGKVPSIGDQDGVMEVGRYLDFHSTDGNANDYDVRIDATTSANKNTIYLPTVTGELVTHTKGSAAGSSTQPVYISSTGVAAAISSYSGNSATATKLATARTISLTGDVTGSISFDGSANKSFTAYRRGCYVGQSSSTATNPYYCFASITCSTAYEDRWITFHVRDGFNNPAGSGIMTAHLRMGSSVYTYTTSTSNMYWESCNGSIDISKFYFCVATDGSSQVTVELYVKIDTAYQFYIFDVIAESSRYSRLTSSWTLYSKASEGSVSEDDFEATYDSSHRWKSVMLDLLQVTKYIGNNYITSPVENNYGFVYRWSNTITYSSTTNGNHYLTIALTADNNGWDYTFNEVAVFISSTANNQHGGCLIRYNGTSSSYNPGDVRGALVEVSPMTYDYVRMSGITWYLRPRTHYYTDDDGNETSYYSPFIVLRYTTNASPTSLSVTVLTKRHNPKLWFSTTSPTIATSSGGTALTLNWRSLRYNTSYPQKCFQRIRLWDNLTVDGAATVGSTLAVTGNTTLNSTVAINGDVTINAADLNIDDGNITVEGDTAGQPSVTVYNGTYKTGLLIGSGGVNRGICDFTTDSFTSGVWIIYYDANTAVQIPHAVYTTSHLDIKSTSAVKQYLGIYNSTTYGKIYMNAYADGSVGITRGVNTGTGLDNYQLLHSTAAGSTILACPYALKTGGGLYFRPYGAATTSVQMHFTQTNNAVNIETSSGIPLVLNSSSNTNSAVACKIKYIGYNSKYWSAGITGSSTEPEYRFAFDYSGTQKAYIDTDGNFVATGDVVAYSDARLKSNIETLEDRGFLRPVEFDKDGKHNIGFIAQEVQKVYPELVNGNEGEEGYLSLNYGAVTAALETQIIRQQEEIDNLKKEVEELKELVKQLCGK